MNKDIKNKLAAYPAEACEQLSAVRALIFEVAAEEELGQVTESLKWDEPSFATKKGSPIRMDWKPKFPDQISIYFNCKSSLIETFREVYSDTFQFSGNRELTLPISEPIPTHALKACLSMALRYHSIKHLPLLGA